MTPEEWIERCSARLRRQWPTLAQADLDETAAELHADPRWRGMKPEKAAVAWLQLGSIVH